MGGGRLYEQLAWPEIAAAQERGAAVIVPVGAIEQHGPQLPVDTDTFFAREFAMAGSEGYDVIVAPSTPFGYRSRPLSGGGPTFPGTMSLSGHTLVNVLRESLARLVEQGFKKLLIYSVHWENKNFAYEAAYLAAEGHPDVKVVVVEEPCDCMAPATMTALFGDRFPGWPAEHAAAFETSLMLYMRPELVRMENAPNEAVEYEPPYDVIPPLRTMLTPSGVRADATRATAEAGRLAYEDMTNHLASILEAEFPETALKGRDR